MVTSSVGQVRWWVDGLEDDQGLYDMHEISAHRRGKGRNANKWLFLTSWTGYFYPRDQDWYPPSCFVTDDFINTVFQDYVIANNLPADLLVRTRAYVQHVQR